MGDEVLLGHRAEMVDVWDDGLQELDPIEEAPGDVRSTDRDLDLSALPGGVAEDDHGGRGRDQGLLTAVEADADRLGEPVQPQHPHPSRPGERKLLDIDGIAAELWAGPATELAQGLLGQVAGRAVVRQPAHPPQVADVGSLRDGQDHARSTSAAEVQGGSAGVVDGGASPGLRVPRSGARGTQSGAPWGTWTP